MALSAKPSGCIVWIYFDPDSLELGPFYFFGGDPNESLPNISEFKIGKHTKGNAQGHKAERPNFRVVNKGRFTKYELIRELYDKLFASV